MTMKHLTFLGGSECVTKWEFLLILKIVKKDPFSRLQVRAEEMFNRHQLFFYKKQYVKI